MTVDAGKKRAGFAALIGAPNAGKSTLVNALVGSKVAIVSHKVQTTRTRIRGIAMIGQTQLILVDTPGIFIPKRRLDRAMVQAAWSEAAEADVAVLIVDAARGIDEEVEPVLEKIGGVKPDVVLVLNKIDKVKKDSLLTLATALTARARFAGVFMVSAQDGSGVDDLRADLAARLPESEWLFPEDQVADVPLRQMAAEITREKLYHRLHDELPYASTVETTAWKKLKDGSIRIEQTIFVERDSQRKIVLGHKGETIKWLSMTARKDIIEVAASPVHLFLFVKVRDNWGEDPERYREMGLEYPKG